MMTTKDLDLEKLLSLEFIETNGIGGYSSFSIGGANTRKYHGILVASENPPTQRKVLVAKVEERIKIDDTFKDLSLNQYPGSTHPNGNQYLLSFERQPITQWTYGADDWEVQKSLFMVQGSNTTVLYYENTGKRDIEIELHPLFSDKDFHGNFHENAYFDFYYESLDKGIKIHSHADSAPLFFNWSKGAFNENRSWYKNIQLYREAYRGTEDQEDFYRIGYTSTALKPGQAVSIIFSTDKKMIKKKAAILLKKRAEEFKANKISGNKDPFYTHLLASGNQFLVDRKSTQSKSIIAGYHWFSDWGRDTMISMRGLTIATGKKDISKSILKTFLKYLDQGMIPNRFPDYKGQEVEYNTIDATLWMFVTVYEYYLKFKDKSFIKSIIPELESILEAHIEGTRYNIKVTEEGFIYGGEEGWQLTWMDAKVNDFVATPRIGCPVEITCLWYNALMIYEELTDQCKYEAKVDSGSILKSIKKNFKKYYLNEEGYLNDVVIPSEQMEDKSFRCNQIYAVSLPFSLLNKTQQKKIVKLSEDKILTNFGLRSLSPDDSEFRPVYEGDQWSRDTAYHQGTVWSFFISEYCEAYLKVNNNSQTAKKKVKSLLEPLKNHFYNSDCVHGISEIFDGLEPNEGRGCVQQAWSVAALVKLYTQYDLYKLK